MIVLAIKIHVHVRLHVTSHAKQRPELCANLFDLGLVAVVGFGVVDVVDKIKDATVSFCFPYITLVLPYIMWNTMLWAHCKLNVAVATALRGRGRALTAGAILF
jgi:hypothetical protein